MINPLTLLGSQTTLVKWGISIAFILGAGLSLYTMYSNWHLEPIEQRDKCFQDLKDTNLTLSTKITSLESMVKKIGDDTSILMGNEYSNGYAKGLSDGKALTNNDGKICFTPIITE